MFEGYSSTKRKRKHLMTTHKIGSRAAIITQRIVGKICSVTGYTVGGFGLIGLMLELTEGSDATAIGLAFFFMIVGGLFIYSGIRIKRRINRFKHYVSLISLQGITNLEMLAAQTAKPVMFVRDDLQNMINKKFFRNASIDALKGEILILGGQTLEPGSPASMENYNCSRCGGSGIRERGSASICEYCGSVVH